MNLFKDLLKYNTSKVYDVAKTRHDNRLNVGNQYMDESFIKFYQSSEEFFKSKEGQRVILLTTKSAESYAAFKFKSNDTLLFGRESAGVPDNIHQLIKDRLKIPMENDMRSLNISSSVAIVLAESLKQTGLI